MSTTKALALLSLLGLASCTTYGFGPYFSLGPTSSWIREANTTLVLPETPNPQKDRLALWPGMGTSGDDLIQALAVSFADPAANCGANAGQWCTWASTLQDGTQLGGTQVPANPGDKLTMHYKYNDSTGNYDQSVAINGEVVSTLSTNSGQAQGWGTAVECQDDACYSTTAAHQYLDTTIILNSADSSFGNTLAINEATSSGLTTSDGGKTWSVATINIDSHTFNV
ncbi:hypothetical protein CNMCM5793_008200 [Aspergillus hiratsukae]|uniref:Uncharacterized protein n=1 Tax=Aspergillus hiratsukae TaxID=1194566 RepID=A0A8H6P6S0_9EURO|nr:hypothetical protein CNMCM5793_008200 [Aspergillus hiratsukae]KAF7163701.1 hypothetical protein CNMCM6106_000517 [Aspergillus hiratsukae]